MIYFQLFFSFLQIGLFSIGGGYAAMPLIEQQVVTQHAWMTVSEFTDLVTIAEMTPGPIAVNAATFVGTRIAGPLGAVIATCGTILPGLVIVMLLTRLYVRYKDGAVLQKMLGTVSPAVVALIASAAITLMRPILLDGVMALRLLRASLVVLCFVLLRYTKISPILLMLGCGVLYTLIRLIA